MANCKDCIHHRVCRMKSYLEKVDEFIWDELRNIESVEKFCKYFSQNFPENNLKIIELIEHLENEGLLNMVPMAISELKNKYAVKK